MLSRENAFLVVVNEKSMYTLSSFPKVRYNCQL